MGEVLRPDRETARLVDLDFIDPKGQKHSHFDIKTPLGSEILALKRQFRNITEMGYRIGLDAVDQKYRFLNRTKANGPKSAENVGHILDLYYVPDAEKELLKRVF